MNNRILSAYFQNAFLTPEPPRKNASSKQKNLKDSEPFCNPRFSHSQMNQATKSSVYFKAIVKDYTVFSLSALKTEGG